MSKNLSPSTAIARTRRITQLMLLFAVLILLAGAGGLYVLNGKIGEEQKVESARETVVGSSKQIASRYQTALGNYNDSAGKLRYLEASVPQNVYVPTLLQQLQSLAKSTQLTLNSVRPGSITQATAPAPATPAPASGDSSGPAPQSKPVPLPYSTMAIALDVTGSYGHIMRFLYDLPQFPKILTVQSLALHPGEGQSLSASINLMAYVFDPAKDVSLDTANQVGPTGLKPVVVPAVAATHSSVVADAVGHAVGTARNDAATADEQAKGQGILAPEGASGPSAPASPALGAAAAPTQKGGQTNGKVPVR